MSLKPPKPWNQCCHGKNRAGHRQNSFANPSNSPFFWFLEKEDSCDLLEWFQQNFFKDSSGYLFGKHSCPCIPQRFPQSFWQEYLLESLELVQGFLKKSYRNFTWGSFRNSLQNSFKHFYRSKCMYAFVIFFKHSWNNSSSNFIRFPTGAFYWDFSNNSSRNVSRSLSSINIGISSKGSIPQIFFTEIVLEILLDISPEFSFEN